MKQLIWKEIMELRIVALGTAVLVLVAAQAASQELLRLPSEVVGSQYWPIFATLSDAYGHGSGAYPSPSFRTFDQLDAIWLALALGMGLAAGTTIASEVERRTAGFLTSLPVSRRRLWLAKVLAGLALGTVSTAFAAWCVSGIAPLRAWVNFSDSDPLFPLDLLPPILAIGVVYAVSLLASSLLDRSLTSTVLGIVSGLGLLQIASSLPATIDPMESLLRLSGFLVFLIVACLSTSLVAFNKVEGQQSTAPIRAAVPIAVVWTVAGLLLYARLSTLLADEQGAVPLPAILAAAPPAGNVHPNRFGG